MKLTDIIASTGVLILLLAFVLNLYKRVQTGSRMYALLNLIGAALCGIAAWMMDFYPFVVLEFVWAIVALLALWRNVPRGTSMNKT